MALGDLPISGGHPYVREHLRYLDTLYLLVDVPRFVARDTDGGSGAADGSPVPWEALELRRAERLGGRLLAELEAALHPSICTVILERCTAGALSFAFGNLGAEVLKAPAAGAWALRHGGFLRLSVSEEGVSAFKRRMNQILRTSTGATFHKTINRWNTAALALIAQYREAVENTAELELLIEKFERKVQNVIKIAINSKMPVRFPAVVFFAPRSVGGLGMHRATRGGRTRWADARERSALAGDEGAGPPSIRERFCTWDEELRISDEIYKSAESLSFEEAKALFNKGVPRLSTRFHRNKSSNLFDRGFRIRVLFKKHSTAKEEQFAFASPRHDGRLWDLSGYDDDLLAFFGGPEEIYSHTLHGSLCLGNEALVFEEVVQTKQMTKAQKSGLSQVPNRRFIFWWSPTINRARVYVGYRTQLDLTGVFMYGKLSTVKVSYVQIFRNHLWQGIHRSLVDALIRNLDYEVRRCDVHAKKSLRIGDTAPDFIITGVSGAIAPAGGEEAAADELWVDVQLRWCNYDDRNLGAQAESLFERHRSRNGFVVLFDLCYAQAAVFGLIPRDVPELAACCSTLLRTNPLVAVLRERIRGALGLRSTEPRLTNSNVEIFDAGCIVQLGQGRLFLFRPKSGLLETETLAFGRRDFRTKAAELVTRRLAERGLATGVAVVPTEMQNAFEPHLSDHPFLTVKATETRIHFEALPELQETQSLYAGWSCGGYTGFCRLALVLKAGASSPETVRELWPVWSTMTDNEWVPVENRLRDLVLDKYARERFLSREMITQRDFRDIVFGMDVYKNRKIVLGGRDAASDGLGAGILLSDWQGSFFHYERNVDSIVARVLATHRPGGFPVPRNVVETVVRISDLQRPLFAVAIAGHRYALLPQFSTYSAVYTAGLPESLVGRAVGVLLFNGDASVCAAVCRRLGLQDVPAVLFDNGHGPELVDDEGVFLIPQLWNRSFCRRSINDVFSLQMGVPQRFFDEECRVSHFREFYDQNR